LPGCETAWSRSDHGRDASAGIGAGLQSPDEASARRIVPRGDPNDTNVLHRFAVAVLAAEPAATGAAISYYEAGGRS